MIPKSFMCMGYKVKVVIDDTKDTSLVGTFDGNKHTITLDKNSSKQSQEQTFWHEWVHCALGTLGYKKLDNDEDFVDRMASLLYQLEVTRKE